MPEALLEDLDFDFGVSVTRHAETKPGKWIVEGYATTMDLGTDNVIITEEALRQAENDLLERSTVLYNHDQNTPIGRVLRSEVKDKGLWIKVMISRAHKDIWDKIQEGVLNKFSIRGKILDSKEEFSADYGSNVTYITRIKLLEVSVVSVPAVSQAEILKAYVERKYRKGVKNLSDKVEDKKEEIKENVSEGKDETTRAAESTQDQTDNTDPIATLSTKMDAMLNAMNTLAENIGNLVERKAMDNVASTSTEDSDENKTEVALEEKLTSIERKMEEFEKKIAGALVVRGFDTRDEKKDDAKETLRSVVDDPSIPPRTKLEKVLEFHLGGNS